ncbi:hypothetical protein [Pseudomonas azerbaijanoccidentalis]
MNREYKMYSADKSSDVPEFVALWPGPTVSEAEVVKFGAQVNGGSGRDLVWNMIFFTEMPPDVGHLASDGTYTAPSHVFKTFSFILLVSRESLEGDNSAMVVEVVPRRA